MRQAVTAKSLRVGGVVPFSTVDYPGHLALVVFCQGCPWRCSYCHNPHLLLSRGSETVTWDTIRQQLMRRRRWLDAVVFSGGEPTAQPALEAVLKECRSIGFQTAVHTAGPYPKRLARLLPHLDWVGFDVKAPLDSRYDCLTGVSGSAQRVTESLGLLLAGSVPYEVRTTVDPDWLLPTQVAALAAHLAELGVSDYVLQAVRSADGSASDPLRGLDAPRLAAPFRQLTVRAPGGERVIT